MIYKVTACMPSDLTYSLSQQEYTFKVKVEQRMLPQ